VRVIEGWSEFQFAEKRMPTLDELNAAAPETPVFVLHLYASAMLNRAVLRAVGYTCDTPDQPGGEIQRDKACNPTGLLTIAPDAVPFFRYLSINTETMEQCRHDFVQAPHPDSPWPGRHGTVAGSCCRGYDPQRALSHGRYGRSGPGCARPVRKAGLPKQ
jgi:hypothetical protein